MPYKNKEDRNARDKKYQRTHKVERATIYKKSYQTHKTKRLEKAKKYRENHEMEIIACKKKYRQTEKSKADNRKMKAQRRQLGFFALNQSFKGCEGHHISEKLIIYIPIDLHKSIQHNIWNWKNMNKINQLAFAYL